MIYTTDGVLKLYCLIARARLVFFFLLLKFDTHPDLTLHAIHVTLPLWPAWGSDRKTRLVVRAEGSDAAPSSWQPAWLRTEWRLAGVRRCPRLPRETAENLLGVRREPAATPLSPAEATELDERSVSLYAFVCYKINSELAPSCLACRATLGDGSLRAMVTRVREGRLPMPGASGMKEDQYPYKALFSTHFTTARKQCRALCRTRARYSLHDKENIDKFLL